MKIFIERDKVSINHIRNYGNLVLFALVLIGLVVIFSYGMGNVSAASNATIYVNGSGGHDTNDGSSWLLAKQSIKNATKTVNVNGTVNIANGNYSGVNNTEINIDKNMNIIGQSETRTIINGTDTKWIFSILSGINVTIINLTLTNAKTNTDVGGAIYNTGTLTVTNTTFTNNTGQYGGAIYNDDSTLTLKNCNFTGNIATDDGGGAIYNIDSTTLTLENCNFTGNIATDDDGGAIYNEGTLNVTGSNFTGNTATYNGGAIYNNGGALTITGSNFSGNTATDDDGGAIYNDYGGTLTVNRSIFNGNTAPDYGGAIYNSNSAGSTLNVINSTFTGNTATDDYGGAISNYGNLNLTNSTFTDNNAMGSLGEGGALYNSGGIISSPVTISGCTFNGNHALNYGGAIDNTGILNVTYSNFTSNSAYEGGGAIMNYESTLTVTSSTFTGNSVNYADYGGGAIINFGGISNIHFNRIIENTATKGSDLFNTDTGPMDASLNWWGSNADPSGNVYGTVTVTPWLVLSSIANPVSIGKGAISAVKADLLYDSGILTDPSHPNLYYHNPTNGHVPDGITVKFINDTLGTVHPLIGSLLNGAATTTFKAGLITGISIIKSTVDSATSNVNVTITVPPVVASTNPVNNTVNIGLNKVIKITFNEPIKAGSMWIEFKNYTTGTAKSFTTNILNNVLSITPTMLLTTGTKYIVIIHSNSITDTLGTGFVGPYGIKFTTTLPPVVTSTNPVNNAVNVPINKIIKITFNKNIKYGTNPWIELNNTTIGKAKPFTTTITSNTLNITPLKPMSNGTHYTVILHTNSITDTTGAGLIGPYTNKYTTTNYY